MRWQCGRLSAEAVVQVTCGHRVVAQNKQIVVCGVEEASDLRHRFSTESNYYGLNEIRTFKRITKSHKSHHLRPDPFFIPAKNKITPDIPVCRHARQDDLLSSELQRHTRPIDQQRKQNAPT